eukprot:scaffold198729_cov35-Tisochrysis_lutea.AAC.2
MSGVKTTGSDEGEVIGIGTPRARRKVGREEDVPAATHTYTTDYTNPLAAPWGVEGAPAQNRHMNGTQVAHERRVHRVRASRCTHPFRCGVSMFNEDA